MQQLVITPAEKTMSARDIALGRANQNPNRIEVVSDTTVLVLNHPGQTRAWERAARRAKKAKS